MANTKHSTNYYKNKILLVLNQAGKKPLTRNDMIAKSKCKKTESDVFKKALDEGKGIKEARAISRKRGK